MGVWAFGRGFCVFGLAALGYTLCIKYPPPCIYPAQLWTMKAKCEHEESGPRRPVPFILSHYKISRRHKCP